MNAVDTNILIYSIDSRDETKRRRAVELIESLPETDTIMPWQVACEVAAVLGSMARAGKFQGDHAEAVALSVPVFPSCFLNFPRCSALCGFRCRLNSRRGMRS